MRDDQKYLLRELSSRALSISSRIRDLSTEIRDIQLMIDRILIEERPKKKRFKIF